MTKARAPKKAGRPSVFTPAISERVQKLAAEGKTEQQIAAAVGVSRTTLANWKKKHRGFVDAVNKGKEVSDEKVEVALFERATGYSHPEVDIRVVAGEIVQTPITKHYPPDATSMIFWLKNRKPKVWRDKVEVGNTDSEGNDVKPVDPLEIARRVAFILAGATQ